MTSKTQVPQFSAELQQQISVLNARIGNANFAQADLLKELNSTFTVMAKTIVELQKENAELKAKAEAAPKKSEK
ncbi:MAG: hypothetical protein CW716_03120 [Candidatus Bathyarchaeum sp.]|nr:MAG: hypothetical protein CW716_03120 [Candidatus Bathyarchaeum sp.]